LYDQASFGELKPELPLPFLTNDSQLPWMKKPLASSWTYGKAKSSVTLVASAFIVDVICGQQG
jgi:hypothetical protein